MPANGEVAVVTGAGRGIGRATATRLAAAGYAVLLADIDGDRVRAAADEIAGSGAAADHVLTDVGDPAQAADMVERAVARFGRLDVLVNNVGIATHGRVHELGVDRWRHVIDTTLSSVFYCAKYAIPHMLERGGGRVVNIASVRGLVGNRGSGAYNAAKGGVVNLTRNIAVDYARDGIRCNCICPGHIRVRPREETARHLSASGATYPDVRSVEELEALHPLGRVGTPEEIADVVCYLASPQASFITGAAIVADGGLTAQGLG